MVMGVADPGAMNAVYGPYSNALRSPLSRQEADGTVVQMQRVLEFLIKSIQNSAASMEVASEPVHDREDLGDDQVVLLL